MRNVFLLYMPPGNREAMVHYEDTIVQKVTLERIGRFVSQDVRARLEEVFGRHRIGIWGSVAGPANRGRFDRMAEGDDLLIVEGDRIKLIGKIAAKTVSGDLSRELWQPLQGRTTAPWELIYFIANSRELDVPFTEFCKLFGYEESYRLRGFAAISEQKAAEFFDRYGDLYSVLVRLKHGMSVTQKAYSPATAPTSGTVANDGPMELHSDDIDLVLSSELVSDHTKMQWKLARLGVKAGEKV
jgi:hypothetical protein